MNNDNENIDDASCWRKRQAYHEEEEEDNENDYK